MSDTYTSGRWVVKPGEDDEFVEAWKAFVTWASEMPGSGTFRLARDLDHPNTYLSFAPWESVEAQAAWLAKPEFGEYIGRARSHCEDFQSSIYELVAEVE